MFPNQAISISSKASSELVRRRRPSRRTGSSFFRPRTAVHSAHVGTIAVVHYPFHPLRSRECRVVRVEQGPSEVFISLEDERGVIQKLPAWMLDRTICEQIELGAPRVSLCALEELNQLLVFLGLQRSHPGGVGAARDGTDEETESIPTDPEPTAASSAARSAAVDGNESSATTGGGSGSNAATPGGGRRQRDGGGR